MAKSSDVKGKGKGGKAFGKDAKGAPPFMKGKEKKTDKKSSDKKKR